MFFHRQPASELLGNQHREGDEHDVEGEDQPAKQPRPFAPFRVNVVSRQADDNHEREAGNVAEVI